MDQAEQHAKETGQHARLPAEPRPHHRHQRHVPEPHRLPTERQARAGPRAPDNAPGHHRPDQAREHRLEAEPADRPRAGQNQPADHQQAQPRPPRARGGIGRHRPIPFRWSAAPQIGPGADAPPDGKQHQARDECRRVGGHPGAALGHGLFQWPRPPEHVGEGQRRGKRPCQLRPDREERAGRQPGHDQTGQEPRNRHPVGDHPVAEVDPGGGREQPEEERVGQPAAGDGSEGERQRSPGIIAGKLREGADLPPPKSDDDNDRGTENRGRTIDRRARGACLPGRALGQPALASRQPSARDGRLRPAEQSPHKRRDHATDEHAWIGKGHQSVTSGGVGRAAPAGAASARRIDSTTSSGDATDASITTSAHAR